MAKKNNQQTLFAAIMAGEKKSGAIKRAAKGIRGYGEAGQNLSKLNAMRGGEKGFKGFVMEELEAAEATACGRSTHVLNDNGIADLKHLKTDGTDTLQQVKVGYKPGQIDFARYKGQKIVLDKGNPYFRQIREEAAKAGVQVVEGHVTHQEAQFWADAMQAETKITGGKHAVLTPAVYRGVNTVSAVHRAGSEAAKAGAMNGLGSSLGENLVEVVKGKKSVGEAAADVAIDTAQAGVVSYGMGAAGSAISSTTAGAAALKTMGTAGAALAKAPVIGSAIAGGGAVTGAIGGLSTAAATATTGR